MDEAAMDEAAMDEAAMDEILIRPLTELEQFARCVELQDAVWGYDVPNMVTQKVFLLAAQIGGQVLGAFDGDVMAGYAMSLPGVRNGHTYLHSHHLAVLPQWRNRGVGRRLKLAQRDDALARGFDLMEWTFDPLETRNAYLNIAKLGAIVRRYRRNFYGTSTSPLHGGQPTDRIFAEWWLRSDRVQCVLAGEAQVVRATEVVDVPGAIGEWKMEDATRGKALAAQAAIAAALEDGFARGLAVIGYERVAERDGRFLLGEYSSESIQGDQR
jgi:predicted GNAT superfamily acetyltransferase